MFGCCKTFSGKYIFSRNANFQKRKMFPCVWLHFKKFSGKYFLVFGKEEGKHKSKKTQATTQKKIINDDKSSPTTAPSIAIRDRDHDLAFFVRSRSMARSREVEIAIDGTISRSVDCDLGSSSLAYIQDLAINALRDRVVDRDLDPTQSREGEIAINSAISRRRDRVRRFARSRRRSRSREIKIAINGAISIFTRSRSMARSREASIAISDRGRRTGAREIGADWSSEFAGDHRTNWNVSSPLAHTRALSLSLSLIFRKYFEGKIEV